VYRQFKEKKNETRPVCIGQCVSVDDGMIELNRRQGTGGICGIVMRHDCTSAVLTHWTWCPAAWIGG